MSSEELYLGDVLGSNASDSVSLPIKRRTGLIKKTIFEIKSIVEDTRSRVTGGIETGILLWNSFVLPYMLWNSGSWLQIRQRDVDSLVKLQNLFLGQLLLIQKCPSLLMMWNLGIEPIHQWILWEKLLLYHHLCSLPKSSIAFQIKEIQEKLHYPSLREEILPFLSQHEVIDVSKYSKMEWKRFVTGKIREASRQALLEGMKKYKKLDVLSQSAEEYELKPYFKNMSLALSRVNFRVRCNTVSHCRLHFPSHPRYFSQMFSCPEGCLEPDSRGPLLDSLNHWSVCSRYASWRRGSDLSEPNQLLQYYLTIIKHRDESPWTRTDVPRLQC